MESVKKVTQIDNKTYYRDDEPSGLSQPVVSVESSDMRFPDDEPFAQKITLHCGHWLINTYGRHSMRKFHVGSIINCRYCKGN